MAALTPQAARFFVNTIIAEYDSKHHSDVEVRVPDAFNPPISEGENREDAQIIFYEKFGLSEYFSLTREEQDQLFAGKVSCLSQLFAQSGLLDPPLQYQPETAPTPPADEQAQEPNADNQTKAAPADPEEPKANSEGQEAAPASPVDEQVQEPNADNETKIADKEATQAVSDKPKPTYKHELDEWEQRRIKENEKKVADFVKELDENRRKTRFQSIKEVKEKAIEQLMQCHLRKADYELDPLKAFQFGCASIVPYLLSRPAPAPIYGDARRHFFSQIFAKVWSEASLDERNRIIEQIKPFEDQLNTPSFRAQRMMFKIDRVFNRVTQYRLVKLGLCLGAGAVAFLALSNLRLLAGQFVNSSIVTAGSSAVFNSLPVVVIQISSGIYGRVNGVFVYVTSSPWYQWKVGPIQVVPAVICKVVPVMYLVFFPIKVISFMTVVILYQRAFGPDAKAQMTISKSLGDDPVQLEEAMKAYQVWMRLVEEGPEQGLFKEAAGA